MIPRVTETQWQHFQRLENDNSGLGHYLAAEFLAIHRAIDFLKRSDGKPIRYAFWMQDAVEFVDNLEANIGCKYRDLIGCLVSIEKRGLIKVTGDLDNLFKNNDDVWVQITPKGYLATPKEWWTEEDYLAVAMSIKDEGFDNV